MSAKTELVNFKFCQFYYEIKTINIVLALVSVMFPRKGTQKLAALSYSDFLMGFYGGCCRKAEVNVQRQSEERTKKSAMNNMTHSQIMKYLKNKMKKIIKVD